MNTEQQFAEQIRRALDESAAQLPYRVSYRLQAARQAALGRLKEPQPAREPARMPAVIAPALLPAGAAGLLSMGGGPGENAWRWGRLLLAALTLAVLVAGFVAINEWSDHDSAEEIADLDLAILLDDVPISAYADRGFGVYIKNTDE